MRNGQTKRCFGNNENRVHNLWIVFPHGQRQEKYFLWIAKFRVSGDWRGKIGKE